ncbi:MAG: redox-sensing transcriptional repressor Rex [Clostridia bacterium]|jgi:redox-sensing transcriptional repressor|nr:redox-sensing transcriptional repressor Rex [Clostridia bacterium]
MADRVLSIQGVKRLPYYLKYLKELQKNGVLHVPAAAIAESLDIYEVQVRKDLAAISRQPGKPRVGFTVNALIEDMEHFLGYDNPNTAVLVGAGHLGQALMSYSEFERYGLQIEAAFDVSPDLIGKSIHGIEVYPLDQLESICKEKNIEIGIITTPMEHAQGVCDKLVAGGVKAVWNFAHIYLHVPKNVVVQNEDMAVSFALLSNHLANKTGEIPLEE